MKKSLSRRTQSTLRAFLRSEASGGIVLIAASVAAMIAANSPLAGAYFGLLRIATGPVIAPAIGPMTVQLWVNDALMSLFFLLVGLEIKREIYDGRLASPKQRRLPVIAAMAGIACPALVYLAVTSGAVTGGAVTGGAVTGGAVTGGAAALRPGWAIPAATDIAFAIGVLALAGPRVPASLKLLLATIAVVDDMGAVAIIAVFYGHGLDWVPLLGAAITLLIMWRMNMRGVTALTPYLIGFVLLWVWVMMSGVHATIAGVAAASVIPIRTSRGTPDSPDSPVHRLESGLNPWVAYGVVPLFGFANAGVALGGLGPGTLLKPLVLGIAVALFLGKQAGVFGGIWLAQRFGFARRPARASWWQIYGVSLLAGIGFTMSLFIGGLAFGGDPAVVDEVKIGVLAGSLLSAAAGFAVLRVAPGPAQKPILPASAVKL